MEKLLESYESTWLEPFLIWSITLFVTVSLTLFLLIIIIRSEKINRRKNYGLYTPIIDSMFMSVVFTGTSYADLIKDEKYAGYISKKHFRKLMLRSLINLHQNYDGAPARALEAFYYQSGLIKDSFYKLKSRKTQVVCSGIGELAEMKVTKAFSSLIKLSQLRNKAIRITAINACTRLDVNRGIVYLTKHKDPIDVWEQLNILHAFKRNYAEENEEVELLLTSGNTTVISLGLKIIHTLELARKIPYVADLVANAPNDQIKLEAQDLLHFLTTQTKKGDGWI